MEGAAFACGIERGDAMTACPVCGDDPCETPRLCAAEIRRSKPVGNGRQGSPQPVKSWRDGLITAKALQTKIFAPVRIILPSLIPEGVTIVAGKPKIGKSFFALDVCLAVAGDRFVLGQTKPVQGSALYLALEDNQRRLKKRTDKIMQSVSAPEHLALHTEWRRVDQGGIGDIEAWCKSVENPRLVWIDTLAKIRPIPGRNEQAYAADYRAIEGLQKLAGQYQIGIAVNHHLRKASSEDDTFDDVSGTLGLTGAADTIVIMKRHAGMVKVFVRGRDIEEAEYAAEFNRETCRWRLVGEADEVFRSEQRQAIARALKEAGRAMSVADIMAATERRDRNSTEVLLHKMEKTGEVKHAGRGVWAHPDLGEPTDSVKIGKKVRFDSQPIEISQENDADESYRNLTGDDPGKIGGKIAESAKPLKGNGKADESYHLNDLTGSDRGRPKPPPGEGWHLAEAGPGALVWIKSIQPPALGPAGDDLLDIAPGWGRR
jgi:hypothetical protein